jgi:lycopene beta-cyclase
MKSYDIIIAGGGAAGLSLACHLVQSPLRDRRVLIVEQDAKDQNDRTWCFWTDGPTLFDNIVYRSWSQLQVLSEREAVTLDLHAYRYHMLRGIDLYRFARQALSASPNVNFLQGKYVLPFSERQALVESVLCASVPLSWETCEQALRLYLATILGIKVYCIRREEQGISPLTDWPFPRQTGKRIMAIGTLGGQVKPSTGYAFQRIQQDSSAIVHSLLTVGHPFIVQPDPRRYRFFDSVMLEIMAHHGERIEPIFTALFKRNPVERIFRFLDEVASWRENCRMLPLLPPQLWWQALLQLNAVWRV